MSKISLTTVTNGQNISAINNNFAVIAEQLNDRVLYRDNPSGEPNQMENDLDMNGKNILNIDTLQVENLVAQGVNLSTVVQETATNAALAAANASAASSSATSASNSASQAAATLANALVKTNNLSDVASASTSRTNLGLGNVNNTSDANKPISTATQAALDLKAAITYVDSQDALKLNKAGQTNGAAIPAGQIGEVIEVASGAVSLTNNTVTSLLTLPLTAGVWEVTGVVQVSGAGGGIISNVVGGQNTSVAIGAFGTYWQYGGAMASNNNLMFAVPTQRYNVSTNTNVFAIAQTGLSGGTATGTGKLHATRVA